MRVPLAIILFIISLSAWSQTLEEIMISQDEFQTLSANDNMILLHVGRPEGNSKGHIENAIFIGNQEYTTVSHDSLYTELPGLNDFKTVLQSKGINDQTTIILCSDWESFAQAFRLYFTLDYFGISENARILDGGIKGWAANGRHVSTDTVIAEPTNKSLTLSENKELTVSKDWIKSNNTSETVSIIDARTAEYYSGEKDGDGYYKRSGHIEGAKNITWKNLFDDNFFIKDQKEIAGIFKDQEIVGEGFVVSYCHIGLRATVIYTVGKGLGYETRLYDGSYNEWDRLDESYGFEKSNDR